MTSEREQVLTDLYAAFNRRDVAAVLAVLAPDVAWANGWEGGTVRGPDAVRDYWTRQWAQIDPTVAPIGFDSAGDTVTVTVRQTVRDRDGHLLSEGTVTHTYRFAGGLVTAMEIS
jgi:ketosteroid isomerase-like protein